MKVRVRLQVLVLALAAVAALIGVVAIAILYRAALDTERTRLVWAAQSQARLMEAVTQRELAKQPDFRDQIRDAVVSQIRGAHERYGGFGKSGMFLLGQRRGDSILYLCHSRAGAPGTRHSSKVDLPVTMPFDSPLAEPMRRALTGQSGVMTALDDRGVTVLAAYEPIEALDIGIVAKINLAEIRAPYVTAGSLVAGVAFILIAAAASLSLRLVDPIARHTEESERKLAAIVDNAPVVLFAADRNGHLTHFQGKGLDTLGLGRRDAVGRPVSEVFAKVPQIAQDIRRALEGEEFRSEVEVNDRVLETAYSAIRDTRGEVTSVIGVATDMTEHRKAESEARRLSRAVEQSPASVVITDPNGDIEYVNPKFVEITGYSLEEVIGKNPRILKTGHTSPAEYRELWETITSGNEWRGEFRNKKKNGELYWESASISPIRGRNGAITHFVAVKEDITDRKRSEEALRLSEQRFRSMTANIPGVVYQRVLRPDGSIFYPFVSEGVREIYGFEPEAVMADSSLFRNTIHPADRDRFLAAFEKSAESGTPLITDIRIIARNGRTKWVHVRARPAPKAGDDAWWDGVITDITERKMAEEKLLESERRYRCVAESASDGILSIDRAGKVVSWNAAAERIFGYRSEDIVGQPLDLLIPERHVEAFRKGLESLRRNARTKLGRPIHEVTGLSKDGREIPLEVTFGSWGASGTTYYTAIVRDITERRRIEQEKGRLRAISRQAQKLEALGTLAGGVAHDVNNTLVPVIGLTEMVIEDLPADSPLRANLDHVLAAGRRIGRLVKQILAFSRRDDPKREILDLRPIVGETVELLRSTIPAMIDIRCDLDSVRAEVDATGIHQIIMNLSVNAADAMAHRGGVLTIALKPVEIDPTAAAGIAGLEAGAYAMLTIRDTGTGMDEATLKRVFDPFFTTKPVGAGTGMGLSVVHGIVASHGGAVAVASNPGLGTRFDIYLPLSEEAAKAADAGKACARDAA